MIGTSLPNKIGAAQARTPEYYSAASCSDQPSTAIPRGSHLSTASIEKIKTMSWIAETGTPTLSNITKSSTTDEWRDEMRRFLMVLAPLLTSACILGEPTQAAAETTYPVCLVGGNTDARQCDYANLAQCQATASGGLGYCVTNPAYTSNAYASYRGAGKRIH
jgi:hypothetical protein